MNKVVFSSGSVEWSTPDDLFRVLDDEFHFDLDVCASDHNHKVDLYFTVHDNALLLDWSGHVCFCNPPYGIKIMREFVSKCYFESLKPNTKVVALLPARTDVKWFHDYVYGKAEIRFIRGRLKFGGSDQNAPFPSMICIW